MDDFVLRNSPSLHFVRNPLIVVNWDGRLAEVNCAARVVWGPLEGPKVGERLADCQARFSPELSPTRVLPIGSLCRRVLNGALSGPFAVCGSDLQIKSHDLDLISPVVGPMKVRFTEQPLLDSWNGCCFAVGIELEILTADFPDRYQSALNAAQSHENLWEVYAAAYDRVLPRLTFYTDALQRHCNFLQRPESREILDIGAGTGLQAEKLLAWGKQVTAVEVTHAMLRRLRQRARGRARILEQSAEHLPQLASGSFDAVTVLLAFFDMNERWSALREAMRVLRPGGGLIITEPRAGFNVHALMAEAERQMRLLPDSHELQLAWSQIQTVAPLVNERVTGSRESDSPTSPLPKWSAETVVDHLAELQWPSLRVEDSHLGNCATISAIKPG